MKFLKHILITALIFSLATQSFAMETARAMEIVSRNYIGRMNDHKTNPADNIIPGYSGTLNQLFERGPNTEPVPKESLKAIQGNVFKALIGNALIHGDNMLLRTHNIDKVDTSLFRHHEIIRIGQQLSQRFVLQTAVDSVDDVLATIGTFDEINLLKTYGGIEIEDLKAWFRDVYKDHAEGLARTDGMYWRQPASYNSLDLKACIRKAEGKIKQYYSRPTAAAASHAASEQKDGNPFRVDSIAGGIRYKHKDHPLQSLFIKYNTEEHSQMFYRYPEKRDKWLIDNLLNKLKEIEPNLSEMNYEKILQFVHAFKKTHYEHMNPGKSYEGRIKEYLSISVNERQQREADQKIYEDHLLPKSDMEIATAIARNIFDTSKSAAAAVVLDDVRKPSAAISIPIKPIQLLSSAVIHGDNSPNIDGLDEPRQGYATQLSNGAYINFFIYLNDYIVPKMKFDKKHIHAFFDINPGLKDHVVLEAIVQNKDTDKFDDDFRRARDTADSGLIWTKAAQFTPGHWWTVSVERQGPEKYLLKVWNSIGAQAKENDGVNATILKQLFARANGIAEENIQTETIQLGRQISDNSCGIWVFDVVKQLIETGTYTALISSKKENAKTEADWIDMLMAYTNIALSEMHVTDPAIEEEIQRIRTLRHAVAEFPEDVYHQLSGEENFLYFERLQKTIKKAYGENTKKFIESIHNGIIDEQIRGSHPNKYYQIAIDRITKPLIDNAAIYNGAMALPKHIKDKLVVVLTALKDETVSGIKQDTGVPHLPHIKHLFTNFIAYLHQHYAHEKETIEYVQSMFNEIDSPSVLEFMSEGAHDNPQIRWNLGKVNDDHLLAPIMAFDIISKQIQDFYKMKININGKAKLVDDLVGVFLELLEKGHTTEIALKTMYTTYYPDSADSADDRFYQEFKSKFKLACEELRNEAARKYAGAQARSPITAEKVLSILAQPARPSSPPPLSADKLLTNNKGQARALSDIKTTYDFYIRQGATHEEAMSELFGDFKPRKPEEEDVEVYKARIKELELAFTTAFYAKYPKLAPTKKHRKATDEAHIDIDELSREVTIGTDVIKLDDMLTNYSVSYWSDSATFNANLAFEKITQNSFNGKVAQPNDAFKLKLATLINENIDKEVPAIDISKWQARDTDLGDNHSSSGGGHVAAEAMEYIDADGNFKDADNKNIATLYFTALDDYKTQSEAEQKASALTSVIGQLPKVGNAVKLENEVKATLQLLGIEFN